MGSIHSRKIHKDMDSRRLAPVIVLMSDQYLKEKTLPAHFSGARIWMESQYVSSSVLVSK